MGWERRSFFPMHRKWRMILIVLLMLVFALPGLRRPPQSAKGWAGRVRLDKSPLDRRPAEIDAGENLGSRARGRTVNASENREMGGDSDRE